MARWYTTTLLTMMVLAAPVAQAQIEEIEQEGAQRTAAGQAVQKKVDSVHANTRDIVDDYYAHLKLVQGLRMYNRMLKQQLDAQDEEIDLLQTSIADVATIERQILPLMSRMIDGLDQFVTLDVPFLVEERHKRVNGLRMLLPRADVTVAEKTRRVMEAYQIKNDYGRTIEAYKAKLELPDASFDADFLRVGRIALMYRIVGSEDVGYWDNANQQWVPLSSGRWRRYINQGLKVARQEVAPELISVALDSNQEVRR